LKKQTLTAISEEKISLSQCSLGSKLSFKIPLNIMRGCLVEIRDQICIVGVTDSGHCKAVAKFELELVWASKAGLVFKKITNL
jgi:hypothetical protein